uniref:Uncharacterized protein n=1 Tax=Glossina pallidipes TaxID=7398 RepID=A0A1B0A8P1_GLOPL
MALTLALMFLIWLKGVLLYSKSKVPGISSADSGTSDASTPPPSELDFVIHSFRMPTIKPKRPIAEPKISTIKIFTNKTEFAASAKAAPEPTTPTETPQNKLTKPTAKPAPNIT